MSCIVVVNEQKIDVDAVSGATNSSTVLKKAVEVGRISMSWRKLPFLIYKDFLADLLV